MENIQFNRQKFDKVLNFFKPKGKYPQTSQIRVLVPFVKGKSFYDIDIKKAASHVLNRTLKDNDLFVVRALGIGLMVEDTTMPGHAPVLSYPMPDSANLPTGIKGFVNQHAQVLYNGVLSIRTGQTVNYSGFPLAGFEKVPQTQTGEAGVLPMLDEKSLLQELPEELVFDGIKDYSIRVEYPGTADTNIAGPAGTVAYLVFIAEGWLVEGGGNCGY